MAVVRTLPDLWLPPSGFIVTPVIGYWERAVPVGSGDPREVARSERIPVADLVDPGNRVTVVHPSGYRGPGFQVADMLVWGFTAGPARPAARDRGVGRAVVAPARGRDRPVNAANWVDVAWASGSSWWPSPGGGPG